MRILRVGATLRKLSALTVDDFGKETFATGGALQNIQKSVELERLSLYFDSDICPWNTEKPWHNLIPSEWIQIFEPQNKNGKNSKKNPEVHSYLLKPVTGNARYIKLPSNESRIPEKPLQKAIVYLDDVTLCLSKEGYRDTLMLADNFSFFNQRLKYVHHRPHTSIKLDPVSWWKYAYRVVIDEMKKARQGRIWTKHCLPCRLILSSLDLQNLAIEKHRRTL
ncbi:hypothetical protein ZOSMA_43G00990 [Zostera marina]|uniref:Uncharacterized protein n=1 Tax=Zostera marina TaxID=29655 RepID=A0A0K9P1Q2_ZOSMR|nr:hypothetical protein ZOSMA_43G00990 [Zostera marina]